MAVAEAMAVAGRNEKAPVYEDLSLNFLVESILVSTVQL